ncbi:uncharacterized protein LOC119568917 [Penaeus monodon]|uniref:uncharacterized protein LOC119568917 n=1 Tax=Penaeus monodon TaxID=6687 RepID=UPI0018A7B280|nr:uncharacterized protein LOC119568917 [Penaeus monodon]
MTRYRPHRPKMLASPSICSSSLGQRLPRPHRCYGAVIFFPHGPRSSSAHVKPTQSPRGISKGPPNQLLAPFPLKVPLAPLAPFGPYGRSLPTLKLPLPGPTRLPPNRAISRCGFWDGPQKGPHPAHSYVEPILDSAWESFPRHTPPYLRQVVKGPKSSARPDGQTPAAGPGCPRQYASPLGPLSCTQCPRAPHILWLSEVHSGQNIRPTRVSHPRVHYQPAGTSETVRFRGVFSPSALTLCALPPAAPNPALKSFQATFLNASSPFSLPGPPGVTGPQGHPLPPFPTCPLGQCLATLRSPSLSGPIYLGPGGGAQKGVSKPPPLWCKRDLDGGEIPNTSTAGFPLKLFHAGPSLPGPALADARILNGTLPPQATLPSYQRLSPPEFGGPRGCRVEKACRPRGTQSLQGQYPTPVSLGLFLRSPPQPFVMLPVPSV